MHTEVQTKFALSMVTTWVAILICKNNMLKENSKTILILVLVIFSFYWFEIRPMNINKHCIAWAKEKTESFSGEQSDVRYFFWKCTKEYGL